jgi:hypothetical protein
MSRTDAQHLLKDMSDRLKPDVRRNAGSLETYLVHFALAPRLMPAMRRPPPARRSKRK